MNLMGSPQAVFNYMAHQNLTWPAAIAELVDNSFDANAFRVELRFSSSPKFWEVKDDGRGCSDISRMLPLGSHFDQGSVSQPVGVFGIGLKDAWAFSGNTIRIESVSKGRKGTLEVDIANVPPTWDVPDPIYESSKASTGTCVRIDLRKDRRLPRDETWDRIRWLFTPALKDGRQIAISSRGSRKTVLKAFDLPPFIESVEDTFDVEGKSVSINIGIVKDGHRMAYGPFWVTYGHRIIKNSPIGAGKYSTLRMGGQISLGKGWTLTKNKDDLTSFVDELAESVLERIEPLLQKHEQLSEDVQSAELKAELEIMLNESIKNAQKEKRESPSNDTGAVLPANTGRRRANYSKSQPAGDGSEKKRKRGFRIDWMEDDGTGLGEFDDLANVVRLNIAHPFVADAKADGNKPALYSVAVALMSHVLCNTDRKNRAQSLLFSPGSFTDTYANVMRTLKGRMEASDNGSP